MTVSINPLAWFDVIRPMSTGHDMVIVTGMPKSGTTAIARLLGAATGESVCSDPFYTLSRMNLNYRQKLFDGQLSLRSLWKKNRRVFYGSIVKDPNFILLLPQVRDLFPDARLLFIVRDPRDNIRSILNRLGLPGDPGEGPLEIIEEFGVGWRSLLTGHTPEVQGKNYVEILAWRWRKAVEMYQEYQSDFFKIRYEDFKAAKSASIIELADQLGYSGLNPIDHLVNIQYQPKGNTAVGWEEFFGKAQLETIERIAAPVLKEFGYASYRAA